MAVYRFTPDAVADLDDIWNFIAADNLEAADRVEKAILAACGSLVRNPLIGDVRVELTGPARPILDRANLSDLHHRLSGGRATATDSSSVARETEHQERLEAPEDLRHE
jgi:plasmid stabilization system protein ParE